MRPRARGAGRSRGYAKPPPSHVFAAYPHNPHLSAKVRAFVDFLLERFGPAATGDRPEAVEPAHVAS